MSTPDEPACLTPSQQQSHEYVVSPRPPSQRHTERKVEKWAAESAAERDRNIHFEFSKQLEALRIQNMELQARVAEVECAVGRVGVAFQHLSSLNSVFQGSTIHNNTNSNSRPREQRDQQHQHYHSSNPHFQDQRREFSQMGDSQGSGSRFRGGGERSSPPFGGRGRGRRGA